MKTATDSIYNAPRRFSDAEAKRSVDKKIAQPVTAVWQNGGELPKLGLCVSKNVYL